MSLIQQSPNTAALHLAAEPSTCPVGNKIYRKRAGRLGQKKNGDVNGNMVSGQQTSCKLKSQVRMKLSKIMNAFLQCSLPKDQCWLQQSDWQSWSGKANADHKCRLSVQPLIHLQDALHSTFLQTYVVRQLKLS